MAWLYRYEMKGIQAWILDSNRLRDLAGGSGLIDALTEVGRKRAEAAGGEIIQGAAGALTVRFTQREALEAFASEWPFAVAHRAPGLQVVQAWVSDESGADGPPLERLRARLGEQRNKVASPLLEGGPWLLRSGRSGLPAVPVDDRLARTRPWQATWDVPSVVKQRAVDAQDRRPTRFGLRFDDDSDRWGEGMVAVIHADVSGVGKRLQGLALSVADMKGFSEALGRATDGATKEALDLIRADAPRIRGRLVVAGGDDVTAVLPASTALDFVIAWLRAFEALSNTDAKALCGRLHAGAGIAFVHRKHPFSEAYRLAAKICGDAKAATVVGGVPSASVLAFTRLTTSRAVEADERTTPWTLAQIGGLRALAEAVKALPRGTMRTWLTLAERGDATRDALWARAKEVSSEALWRNLEQALVETGADPRTGLFAKGLGTPIRDALALNHLLGRADKGVHGTQKEAAT